MPQKNNTSAGDMGEKEVVALVKCPNCGKKLMQLPKNYPLYDVQCEGCSFRAQVKTNNCKPKNIIFGAGWDIIEKVLKSGFLPPQLIVNFKWNEKKQEKQLILFYPLDIVPHAGHTQRAQVNADVARHSPPPAIFYANKSGRERPLCRSVAARSAASPVRGFA